MTDLPSSLGIEAVELLYAGTHPPRSITVRVTGRWRRRRAELRGQAMLVVEGPFGRQRFLAMPEPPSLTGAAPGTWRMSFSVPTALVPSLPGRTYLQLGGVMVPLPIGEVTVAGEGAGLPDPELLEARRARSSELAEETARRRVVELGAQIEQLERDLVEARAESDRLRSEIAERDRRLRTAEQHVHAELSLRADVEQELTRRTRAARHDLAALHERVAEGERELARMRRAVDEAGHLAAAAEAARAAAEAARAVAEPPPAEPVADLARARLTRREFELRASTGFSPPVARMPRPVQRAEDRTALLLEEGMVRRRAVPTEDRSALERELVAAREQIAAQREELEAQRQALQAQREAFEAQRAEVEAQRAEVEAQRGEVEAQRAEVEAQRRRTARAYEAIELVRGELRQLRVAPPTAARSISPANPPSVAGSASPAAGPIQADRLSEALSRLRERTPVPPSEEPGETVPAAEPLGAPPVVESKPESRPAPLARPVKPWLGAAFRALAKQDPSMAGHLVLALLPAQRAADPHPVAYDLVLSDVLSAHVTVDSSAAHVGLDATTRPLAEVDFELVGDPAGIARLLAAGRLRRRLGRLAPGRRMALVRGDRRRLTALDRLIGAALTLEQLGAAGVEFDPPLAMTVAALMIDPEWTVGERFVIAHRQPHGPSPDAYLHVRDGRPVLASADAPHSPLSAVIACSSQELLGVLAGASPAQEVAGDERSLALLLGWLERAQSG